MDKKIICHIIGSNSNQKSEIKKIINENKHYNIIDLDSINLEILEDDTLTKMYKQLNRLKKNKNDKFKEIENKMNKFWEDEMINKVYNRIIDKKITILIGRNHHYRVLSRKVNFFVGNKILIDNNLKKETRKLIKKNLEENKNDIIIGAYPLEYIDFKFQLKKIKTFYENYEKCEYQKIIFDDLIEILKLLIKSKKKELYIASIDPYNINSVINPKNKTITAYSEPILALLDSFNLKDINYDMGYNSENELIIKNITLSEKIIRKLSKNRYLYCISPEHFMPINPKNSFQYISQLPATVLEKEKIKNVYEELKGLKGLNLV
jgi:hypothetical protein